MANPRIIASLTVNNSTANLSFRQNASTVANEESSIVEVTTLTTGSTTIGTGTIINPKYFAFYNADSENSILVGFDGVDYDTEIPSGDFALIRLRDSDKLETQTVTTVADVSDSLDGTYITLEGESGTWTVWIDVDDSGTAAPASGTDSFAEITSILTNDTAAAVALAIYTDLIADEAFMADFDVEYDATVDDDFITITDKFPGTRTNIADTGTTGFTVATTQGGATGRSVYAKSSAGEVEALIAVMPK